MPKCPECNALYGTGDEFCSKCGTPLTKKKEKEIHEHIGKGLRRKELKDTKSKFLVLLLFIIFFIMLSQNVTFAFVVLIGGFILLFIWYYDYTEEVQEGIAIQIISLKKLIAYLKKLVVASLKRKKKGKKKK